MEILLALFGLLVIAPLVVLFEAWLFRLAARLVAGVAVGWGLAVVTVVVAGVVQSAFTGVFFGADAGVCGSIAGFVVWVAMAAWLTELSFGQALGVAVAMTVVHWLLQITCIGLLVLSGLAALLGLALL